MSDFALGQPSLDEIFLALTGSDVIGIPVLFTYLFGGALAGSTHGYLQFLLPGTLVLAVVFVTVYSGVTLNADLATGVFDRFRSMPVWRPHLSSAR